MAGEVPMVPKVLPEFVGVVNSHLPNSKQGTRELRPAMVDDPCRWTMALPTRVVPEGLAEKAGVAEWRPRRRAERDDERAVAEWWWI